MKQRFCILIAAIAMATTTLDAQTDLKTETYTAYILNDVKRWENLTRRCEQQTDTTDIVSLMSLIHCYYGYTMMLAEQKQHDVVGRNIARAERYIAIVLAKEPNNLRLSIIAESSRAMPSRSIGSKLLRSDAEVGG